MLRDTDCRVVFSKKLSDIIGMIDGIAFQTNTLALNAAVEEAAAAYSREEQAKGLVQAMACFK